MSKALNGPIPGQSLTDEPSGFAWERPPETADPNVAIKMHLDKFSDDAFLDSALYLMQLGIPISTLTSTALTVAQGNGIHSVDVSLLIAPVIHKQFKVLADSAGIEYEEYMPQDDPDGEMEREERLKDLLASKLADKATKGKEKISQTMAAIGSPAEEELEDKMAEQEAAPMEATDGPSVTTEAPSAGLMSREA
tara:strand:- start:52 stop:633 length:582 start_codon:yes stop_codon:yes gene_type:complete